MGLLGDALAEISIRGIDFYEEFAREYQGDRTPMLVERSIGTHGEAYDTVRMEDSAEAEVYHSEQIITVKKAGDDLVTAATISNRRRGDWFCPRREGRETQRWNAFG